ncbi:hypothetical protein TNCT_616281 [Trichonephila clavata]|uniref:Uncharacterized protein n=1 Tax=Trichonephila clavata TaxID=2740835 RepID=A0A8X6F538_TRICU|nr:hypothetical protein TNCT_616281 [Trichonephila clavata]
MPRLFAVPQLEEMLLNTYSQQDMLPCHWATHVQEFLDDTLVEKKFHGPSRSPAIASLKLFFLLEIPEEPSLCCRDSQHRKVNQITTETAYVTPQMLTKRLRKIEKRLDIL